MKELSTLLLCWSQIVQLLLHSIYGILGRVTVYSPRLSSTVNQPSKKKNLKKWVLTLLFPLSGKKWLIGKGHKTNATEISGSNFLQNIIKNIISVYAFVTCCNMFMSKAYKTEHKKKLATTFKRNGPMKFYLSLLQDKFHWWWCRGIKVREFMAEKSFLLGSRLDAKADLDSVQGHFCFYSYIFWCVMQEINFLVRGQQCKKAKACWVPYATVSYSQSL